MGSVLAVVLAILAVLSEYLIEFVFGLGVVLIFNSVFFVIGSVIGLIYLVAWILEETDAIDESYIDTTLNVVFKEWYESLSAVEWIRIPLIYMEYLVTIFLGLNEFDPTDERFTQMFMLLATPWLWQLMMLMAPFIAAYMPIIMIVYWSDPSLFAHEVYIWEHDVQIDENDKWIKFFL